MHQYKIRRVIPDPLVREGWYVDCLSCRFSSDIKDSVAEAEALGAQHTARWELHDQRVRWKATRLIPPVWWLSHDGVAHAVIPQRHWKDTMIDESRIMCGSRLAQVYYLSKQNPPKSLCLRCAKKYNRWLVFVSQIVTPLDTKLYKRLAVAITAEGKSRANEAVAILENHRLVSLIANAQNEINALRHYIGFAVNKLYDEHGLVPPPPPEAVVDISKQEVK